MVHIMNYKIYVYVVAIFLSIFALSGINFEKFIKKNRVIEARILVLLLGFALGYLISNFVIDFISSTNIL